MTVYELNEIFCKMWENAESTIEEQLKNKSIWDITLDEIMFYSKNVKTLILSDLEENVIKYWFEENINAFIK